MQTGRAAEIGGRTALAILVLLPSVIAAFAILGPFSTDPLALFSGLAAGGRPALLPGFGTIDPNMGYTAYALGLRAALDLVSGNLPLWNHFEGLGMPLLGEMQSAALFPPTLLLLLPHGQMIEQALLQAVAGVGTFLFLRRFGLGPAAALAGGMIFELNGAFAWLRNAIFLPIAFLPWLFLAIETLFTRAGRPWRERWPATALGAVAAALALYAGFPEVVYFYSLLLLLWAAARAASLPPRGALGFLADLATMAGLAALLAAPALIAFAHFLPEAELGGHRDDLFQGAILPPAALILYWLPYLYGPISAAAHPDIRGIWNSIGGYLGLMPLALGVFGLLAGRRRMGWLLAAWAVAAIGVSHGAPGLHAAFLHVPLASIAAYSRYLNASWIFCVAVLAAIGLDRLPSLAPEQRVRLGLATLAVVIAILAAGLAAAWPILADVWPAKQNQRLYLILSLAVAAALLAGSAAGLRARRAVPWLTLCLGLELMAAFLLPMLSFPRVAGLDRTLVDFLQRHAGAQRTALASHTGLIPNFGSVFGIPTINYDDLPVPARTVDFVRAELDPAASAIMFRPDGPAATAEERERRRRDFVSRLPNHAAAGVRYVIGDPDLFAIPAYPLQGGVAAITLAPGQALQLEVGRAEGGQSVRGVLIRVGTYGGSSDGVLRARLCQGESCAQGRLDSAGVADNQSVAIDFPAPLGLAAGPYALTLAYEGGRRPIALWGRAAAPGARLTAGPGPLPELALLRSGDPAPVLTTANAALFELERYRRYAAAENCEIDLVSQDRMRARCDRPSRLVRLEVFMKGWRARVNGQPAEVGLAEPAFQALDLPAGESTVEFVYAPAGLRPSLLVAAATSCLLAATALRRRRR